jgi:signal transduction histidine kinase
VDSGAPPLTGGAGGAGGAVARRSLRNRLGVARLGQESLQGGPAFDLSIRWRLTLWYTLIVAVMLTAFSLVAYWYLGNSLTADAHALSEERALQVQDLVAAQEFSLPVRSKADPNVVGRLRWLALDESVDPFRNRDVLVRVFDIRGLPIGGSLEFDANPDALPLNRAALVTALKGTPHTETLRTARGPFYVYTRPAYSDDHRLIAAVQILTSRSAYESTMNRLARILGIATLMATGISLALGAAMAHTALAPIDAITRTARQINRRQDLSRRIAIKGPRDEIGRLSETFNDMLDSIEAMFERQRRFLADVSHELRTPLTTMSGEIELLQRTDRLDPEGLEAMSSETKRMARLVSDLLLLARADTGLELRHDPIALEELMAEVARQARTLGGDTHTVRVNGLSAVTVQGDRDRLKQLLLILIDNAVTHTPSGATVTLSLARRADGAAEMSVADDGPGIPVADQQRIFDRFYRVDKARSRASGGTGLGLSIAAWIVKAHDGEIHLESKPGSGSRFTVTLPTMEANHE